VLEEQFGMHCKDMPSTSSTFQQPDTEDGGKSYVGPPEKGKSTAAQLVSAIETR
jgi:hypothetical protein